MKQSRRREDLAEVLKGHLENHIRMLNEAAQQLDGPATEVVHTSSLVTMAGLSMVTSEALLLIDERLERIVRLLEERS